jgi:hypothetical protein
MTATGDNLGTARRAAATLLSERGYSREAALVLAGEGDDFTEVRTALALIPILAADAAPPPPPRPFMKNGRRLAGEEC